MCISGCDDAESGAGRCFWSGASRSWDSGNGPGERDVLHDKNGQHRNFSSFLYLRKRVEEKFLYPYINPENKAILEHLPPSFLITVYGDSLRNYSRQYARAIQKSGGICHLEDLGPHKKLPHAFSTALPEIPESQYVNEKMVKFLMSY